MNTGSRIDYFQMYERWFRRVRTWAYLDIPKWVDRQVAQATLTQLLSLPYDVETLMAKPEYSSDVNRYVISLSWMKEYYIRQAKQAAATGTVWKEVLANWLANEMCILIQEAKDAADSCHGVSGSPE